ncbi:PREDICTED: myosin heavy chain, striated muscle isoform X3 [Tarenaya hassleriana]|uniref:myosin heavy chain, striated muscle isoform X3 n=1 Tax=Tarenaya hassleriana TaxID=28532 RepID=UPI00053C8542|nr:PREDICTED: myosin heavy chain, striated muscle isoform X3 [Tarenaya hassleriana]
MVCSIPGGIPGEKTERLCSMYFGASCVVALRLLTETYMADEKWFELRDKVILLGFLVWRISDEEKDRLSQKLEDAKSEISILKKLRHEDAKANEKVVSIFASQEQNWLNERKKLRLQIEALMQELRAMEKKKAESVSELQERLKETEALLQSKDKAMAEDEHKHKELEEKLAKTEKEAQELREKLEKETQEHSAELWKQKTTFLELVSSQRQLEAELGRAVKQNEAKKHELDLAMEQQEESTSMAEKLSSELLKMRKDLEQKDRILSTMLGKSNLDIAEKQMLLKEIKVSKAKKKQAEQEKEKWRTMSESRKHERQSLRSMFAVEAKSRGASNPRRQIDNGTLELNEDTDAVSEIVDSFANGDFRKLRIDGNSKKYEKKDCGDDGHYIAVMEKRHHNELNAFAQQMRLKDEKLEALCWRLMNAELESKHLRLCIEGLNREMSRLRQDNTKLEGKVTQQGEESVVLKKQFTSQLKRLTFHKTHASSRSKNVKREAQGEQNTETQSEEVSQETIVKKETEANSSEELKPRSLIVQSDTIKIEHTDRGNGSVEEIESLEKSSSMSQPSIMTKNPPWRTDLYALGISCKIKRLKQQLMMLERYTGKREIKDIDETSDSGKRALLLLLPLLSKQVTRYQSLQEKTDDLCKRMHANGLEKNRENIIANGEGKTALEQFLEETFQLQRYIVATGQKLMEIQSKIASGFSTFLEDITHKKHQNPVS